MTRGADPDSPGQLGDLPAGDGAADLRDPLAPVLGLGRRATRAGMAIGLAGALFVHGAAAARGFLALDLLGDFAELVHNRVRLDLSRQIDVELTEPEPEPEPEQEAEPEPEPEQEAESPPPLPADAPVEAERTAPPPAAAEAAEVMTAEPDPNEPLDLTGNTFVTGTGTRYVGGITASAGTSKKAVRDRRATADGTGQPTTRKVAKVASGPDRSRGARPQSTNWSNCPFPAEADAEQVNYARVTVLVTVSGAGKPKSVSVVRDPGYGFGRMARRCAMSRGYSPALNREGKPITSSVRFTIDFRR